MIHPARIRKLNEAPARKGRYVLYWMQASQRVEWNHALAHAAERANALTLPLVVGFGLMEDYPEANARHMAFMLEGLRDVARGLREVGAKLVARRGRPANVAEELSRQAALVVCDRGYLRHQEAWRRELADIADCPVVQVESDIVVPVDVASNRMEPAARTIRPKIRARLEEFLKPVPRVRLDHSSLLMRFDGTVDVEDPAGVLAGMKVDRSVAPSARFAGGEREAQRRLDAFIEQRLRGYDGKRSEPGAWHVSMLSPYLHFGQISPVQVAMQVRASGAGSAEDREAFIEELIVRRELAINFVRHRPEDYDSYDALPAWARQTLEAHRQDPREHIYSDEALEAGETHDPYWNAAQREMTRTGYMHNTMRMYWGKKIIEWSADPRRAHATALRMNNRYFLCGRDPSSHANVGWLFGLHDRPWPGRPIFGTVRYMNAAGLRRKYDMDAYMRGVEEGSARRCT